MKCASERPPFFTVAEAAAVAGGCFFPPSAIEQPLSQSFKVDSRLVEEGDVFVAIRGERVDGCAFVASAIEKGASCVLVDKECFHRERSLLEKSGVFVIIVADGEQGMAELATEWLSRISPQVVGITGSVGKTTTREMLHTTLAGSLSVHAAIKSYNTLIGCSMTILGTPAETDALILELGTNHPGEIAELVARFPVTHAVITEVAPVHLEGLKSLEGVLAAKMEIMESSRLKYLSYNYNNDLLKTAVDAFVSRHVGENGEKIKAVGVGSANADIVVSSVAQTLDCDGTACLSFSLSLDDHSVACEAEIFGSQHARNAGFAYAVARELGVPDEAFVTRLSTFELPPGRGGFYPTSSGGLAIDESYNANPNSVSMALKNFIEVEFPDMPDADEFRRIAILGGMRELGAESDRWHEVIMSRAALCDAVYLIGPEWDAVQTMQPSLRGRYVDTADFSRAFTAGIAKDFEHAVVLVKGSRYYELENILPLLTGGGES